MKCQSPAATMLTSDKGSMNFQAKFMSWSMRRRGSVARIQMNVKTSAISLAKNQRYDGTQVRNENGAVQPPRNSVMPSPLMANMPRYSPRKNSANLKPEYSGFKFALFFLGEYLGMFAINGLGITLFLGGWTAPFSFLTWVPSYLWFFAKLMALVFTFIWIRATLPRLRMDQLMNFAWKFMLPLSLVNIVAAGLWHFLGPGWLARKS